jgi:hypothetical protein
MDRKITLQHHVIAEEMSKFDLSAALRDGSAGGKNGHSYAPYLPFPGGKIPARHKPHEHRLLADLRQINRLTMAMSRRITCKT